MKYRVRTKDGELTFESRAALGEAARTGLVEADDEVQREDESTWKKASAIPGLLTTAPAKTSSPFLRWVLLVVSGAIAAFVLIYKGRAQKDFELQAAGVGVVILVAIILMRITTQAQRRR